ncbi:hypothetical protein ACU7RR_004239 [Providencia stuartii]|nr:MULTISPECIES: hypothetical protein [Providencia]AVE42842.1 hypothetical protein AM353_13970 [Providencia stuartii]MDE8745683.1 hypothetical protein [Providencia thailandensis]MDE8764358.1 hypothetical protein [Providencia thailandensis]MDE8776588.1 hypothetical protein [Providencia thailandensis]MDE8780578.1 hypothetical protein [Providencia thailandensis]
MAMYSFDDLDKEKADSIYFHKLLTELSDVTKRSIADVSTILHRNFSNFDNKYPYTLRQFHFYRYCSVTGFSTDSDFEKQCLSFLYAISLGKDYYEDPNPANSGYYYIEDEFEQYNISFYGFYFKAQEVYSFLKHNKLPIPPCLSFDLPRFEKGYEFGKKVIDKETEKWVSDLFGDTEDGKSVASLESEIEKLKGQLQDLELKVPNGLCQYREDDPLAIAIKLRNEVWADYDEDSRSTIPTQEWVVAKLIDDYKKFNMAKAQAQAIEKVACPIKRK